MKKGLFILFALFTCFLFSVKAQDYKWVKGGGTTASMSGTVGSPNEASRFMCTDPNGNIYILNLVGSGAVYADTFYRSSTYCGSGGHSILVSSYNCSGQMRWSKVIGSYDNSEAYGIVADSFGHIYIGAFLYHGHGDQTVHIGDDTSYSSNPYVSLGLIQFDTTRSFKWLRLIGQNTLAGLGTGSATGNGGTLLLDKQQNIHFVKLITSGVILPTSDTTHYGTYDLSYTSTGSLIRAKRLALDSTLVVQNATIDTNTNKLYAAGEYNISFGYAHNAFIAAFDTARNLIWNDTMYSSVGNGYFSGIATDNIGHFYLLGLGQGTSAYDGDSITGIRTSFIIKTDTSGNALWLKGFTSTTAVGDLMALTLMPNNKIAASGTMAGTITCDHDTITTYSGEGWNTFFTVLDSSGCVHTLEQIHGNAFYDYGKSITSDRVGNLFIGGAVGDTTWAGGVGYRSHGGNTDFYVMKYGMDCSCTSMPVAMFTIVRSGLGGSTVNFTYTGTSSGLDSMRWDFGDGSTSTTTSPTHTYTAAGTYHATVRIYSFCGGDMHCMDIFVPCVATPVSNFTFSGTTATRNFTFTGAGTAIDSIVWDFGDGGHGIGAATSHTYTATGSYTVCATVYNPCGSNSICHTITVPCVSLPVPSFTSSGITATRNFTYTGTTTALDSVVWHYGDGGRGTGTTPSHTYAAIGTYTVCVLAYTPCGVDSSCSTVTITCITRPTAGFTNSGITTVNFSYTGTSTGLDSVVWHYGDGGMGTGSTSSHTYASIGSFTACVLAYNHCGVDSTCHTVTIVCTAPPTASFSNTSITTGSYTDTFTYTGSTTGLDSVAWYFGDGGHSTGLTAYHTYALPDTYTVCVYAYNPCGWDSACYTVIVPCDTPVASFTHTGMIPVNFTYTGSTNHIDSVVWIFSSAGGHSSGMTAAYSYPTTGTYLPCVIAYGLCANDTFCLPVTATGLGVSSMSLHSIVIYPNPTADELFITEVLEQMNYRLLNIAGVSLQQGTLAKGSNTIIVANYAQGVYLLEVTDANGLKGRTKVVKQ